MGVSLSLLDEGLKLMYSFLLAFGVHLNILCVIAQLVLMRPTLMESPSYVPLVSFLGVY
jgi:cell cycle arrest protein BUB2